MFPFCYVIAKTTPVVNSIALPRRVNNPSAIQRLSDTIGKRTSRLLKSYVRLTAAIEVSTSKHCCQQTRKDTSHTGDDVSFLRSINQAIKAHAGQGHLTEEFRSVQEVLKSSCEDELAIQEWKRYKSICRARDAWGKYLLSDFDWDWDLSQSLEILFSTQGQEDTSRRIVIGHGGQITLPVQVASEQARFPRSVRIEIVTSTGVTLYKTYHAKSSSSLCNVHR